MNPPPSRDRLFDLLADRATTGLSAAEQAEVDFLLRHFPDVDADELDFAATALDLSLAAECAAPLPAALRQRIEGVASMVTPRAAASSQLLIPIRPKPRASRWRWWLAGGLAAACLLVGIWWSRPPVTLTPEQRYQQLADRPGSIQLAGASDANARGEVLWNNARQEGFLRLRGLPANDPRLDQYQLWIFDAQRDERYPIDGGVFDIPASGEAIIPIRGKLSVNDPKLFAITREKPGGVVVSERKAIMFTAAARRS